MSKRIEKFISINEIMNISKELIMLYEYETKEKNKFIINNNEEKRNRLLTNKFIERGII